MRSGASGSAPRSRARGARGRTKSRTRRHTGDTRQRASAVGRWSCVRELGKGDGTDAAVSHGRPRVDPTISSRAEYELLFARRQRKRAPLPATLSAASALRRLQRDTRGAFGDARTDMFGLSMLARPLASDYEGTVGAVIRATFGNPDAAARRARSGHRARWPYKGLFGAVFIVALFSLAGNCQPPQGPAAGDKSSPTIRISLRDETAGTPIVEVPLSSPGSGSRIPVGGVSQVIALPYPHISDVGIISDDPESGIEELTVVSRSNQVFCDCDTGNQGASTNFVCPNETSPALTMVPDGTYPGARDSQGVLPTSVFVAPAARLDLSLRTACQKCSAGNAVCQRWTPQHGGQDLVITATNGAGLKTTAAVRLQLN
jgi:hypothetical protein